MAETVLSKFAIGSLALKSAIQMEHLRRQEKANLSPIRMLADALDETTLERSDGSEAYGLRVGFVEPYARVYISSGKTASSEGDLQTFIDGAVGKLRKVAEDDVEPGQEGLSEMVKLCLFLHEEFTQYPVERGRDGRSDDSLEAEACLR